MRALKNLLSKPFIYTFLLLTFFGGFGGFSDTANAELTSPFEGDVLRAVERLQKNSDGRGYAEIGPRILGGIVPHHGLALDMIVRFYERIASDKVQRVWLFSPDHFKRAKNYVAVCEGDWLLADRLLEADAVVKSGLSGMGVVETNTQLFAEEHGITIHIPLIARYFPNATIVPMVLRSDTPDLVLLMLKSYMLEAMEEGDVIILSMDLSHYKTPEGMAAEDERTLEVLSAIEPMKTDRLDIDARRAASLVLRLFKALGAKKGIVCEHMDLSDILGYRVESGTSYATVIYRNLQD